MAAQFSMLGVGGAMPTASWACASARSTGTAERLRGYGTLYSPSVPGSKVSVLRPEQEVLDAVAIPVDDRGTGIVACYGQEANRAEIVECGNSFRLAQVQ